jgi:hypothetical protein
LYIIAERKLGDGNRRHDIKNPDGTSPDPNQLQPGQELCLPGAPSPGCAGIVSRETYNALFPNRNGLYTYDGLIAASQNSARTPAMVWRAKLRYVEEPVTELARQERPPPRMLRHTI